MPHTISPSLSSQGLGISCSTLSPSSSSSPPPLSSAANQPPQRFTGMGVGPGPRLRHQPPSPVRAGQTTPPHTAPAFQPSFNLRPTHTRSNSAKGFASFSALPPSPSLGSAPAPTRRRLPTIPSQTFSKASTSENSHDSNHTQRPAQPQPLERAPSRAGSVASTITTGSRIKRSISSEFMRRLSNHETISGGRYSPLKGDDDEPKSADPHSTHQRTRSETVSSGAPTTSTADAYNFDTSPFPAPPNHHVESPTALSDTTDSQPPLFLARGLPRSFSQPQYLHPVAEGDDFSRQPSPQQDTTKRISDPATGVHSLNAALLSAESGATMLAFSPSGDGVWRQGEMIGGMHTSLISTPLSRPSAQVEHHGRNPSADAFGSRPWSDSKLPPIPQGPPGSLKQRGRSLSDGAAILNRQGTLFHPSSTHERASAELSLMLGGPRSRRLSANKLLSPPDLDAWKVAGEETADKIRLEAAKKRKARVEVDVVLERECIVEGGEIRGRLEVRVTGGKRGDGLRVGGGKVRVIGFEDISVKSRHIFYHHPHSLPVFQSSPTASHPLPQSSLFASDPDSEGYRLAAEGVHFIPFRMRLPLGGGAKGSFTSPNRKGPSVRYVVVGSIKIHIPSSGKRSIAHFYRPVVVLPYLDPATALAPSQEPIDAGIEKGLGWSLTGEKGIVRVSVALGRRNWVAGQRAWCEVAIRNESTRKIKTLNLALLQTVQVFTPDPNLAPGEAFPPDVDACQTSTQRRKVSEEVLEADFVDRGAGRVTGKGWWTGVEAGDAGHWDLSLLIPNGLLSIRRTRLIEVMYTLRVTLNGSIYVDLPITLINFLSIDPPPMPGDGSRGPLISSELAVSIPNHVYEQPDITRLASQATQATMDSTKDPARASSTTLHIDALLSEGRARASATHAAETPSEAKSRPLSMGSQYTVDRNSSPSSSNHQRTQSAPEELDNSEDTRPRRTRMLSYLSDSQSINSAEEGVDENDKASLAMGRAQGRERSLAAIHRAMRREAQALAEEDEELSPGVENEGGVWKPLHTPEEAEAYAMIADTPSVDVLTPNRVDDVERMDEIGETQDPGAGEGTSQLRQTDQDDEDNNWDRVRADQDRDQDEDHEGTWETVGNDTILEELVSSQGHRVEAADFDEDDQNDYFDSHTGPPQEDPRRISFPRQLPAIDVDPRLSIDAKHLSPEFEQGELAAEDMGPASDSAPSSLRNRPRFGSFAPSAVSVLSEVESEVGQVYEAVKRNMWINVPSRVVPLQQPKGRSPAMQKADNLVAGAAKVPRSHLHPHVPRSGSVSTTFTAGVGVSGRRSSTTAEMRRQSAPNARRGSIPSMHSLGKRESSTPSISSPLRPVEEAPSGRVIQKKSSFSFASRVSPLRVNAQLPNAPRVTPNSPGPSPKSLYPAGMLNPPEPIALAMGRQLSGSSLRNEVPINLSPEPSDEGEAPGLAPSVASDSASSDGQALESPPFISRSPPQHSLPRLPHKEDAIKYQQIDPFATSPPEIAHHWQPSPQMNMAQIFTMSDYNADGHGHGLPRLPAPTRSVESHDSHRSSPSSTHSILPSVRTKIAQLESRDEALRKFSVASAASGTAPAQAPAPNSVSVTTSPASTAGRKRRSYTVALAPRPPVRSASDDLTDRDRLGGTTFVRAKVYASQTRLSYVASGGVSGVRGGVSGVAGSGLARSPTHGRLERNLSTSSTSTTATAIEQALMARGQTTTSPRVMGGPRLPRMNVLGVNGWEGGEAGLGQETYEPEYEQETAGSGFLMPGKGSSGPSFRVQGQGSVGPSFLGGQGQGQESVGASSREQGQESVGRSSREQGQGQGQWLGEYGYGRARLRSSLAEESEESEGLL